MSDYVALLGTKGGPAIRTGSPMPTSHLLMLDGNPIVVDCGLGVTRGIADQGVPLAAIRHIFITHLHSDHYLELGPLLHTAWTAGLSKTVDIWGPEGLDAYWDFFIKSMQADIDLRIADEGRPDLRDLVRMHVLDAGDVDVPGAVQVRAMRVDHPPLTDTFALSFQTNETHVVFSSDTAYFPPLAEFAKGADLLIHEAMLVDAVDALLTRIGNGDDRLRTHIMRSHTPAVDAGRIATAAGVKALALNHLLPSDDPAYGPDDWTAAVKPFWAGKLFLGTDGLRIDLPL
jgi:ribonuclease BN (tRNA processing enzyme)